MECAAWPSVMSDLESTRLEAAVFLNNLDSTEDAIGRQTWIARWTELGDAHCLFGDRKLKKGASDEATEAWLCALTAFEVARQLIDEIDPRNAEVSAKIEAGIQRFVFPLEHGVEQVILACDDEPNFLAYYLPAGDGQLYAPAVICISSEQETGAALLGRLLPVVSDKCVSILVVSHDDLANHWCGRSNLLLSGCLDHLSARPGVDATRVGVFGEGLAAILATDFAASDPRVAAAVCDGGLWNFTKELASVAWMTGTTDRMDEDVVSARRSRLVRQLRCPVLVVAGGRGTVSVSEAIKLQAECMTARIDLDVAMPRMIRTHAGDVENFVSADDCIFGWLERKLGDHSVP